MHSAHRRSRSCRACHARRDMDAVLAASGNTMSGPTVHGATDSAHRTGCTRIVGPAMRGATGHFEKAGTPDETWRAMPDATGR